MTLVGPVDTARQVRGPAIVRIGLLGLIGALVLTVVAWLMTEDLFSRFGDSLEVTGEALESVGLTLDVADEALATLPRPSTRQPPPPPMPQLVPRPWQRR